MNLFDAEIVYVRLPEMILNLSRKSELLAAIKLYGFYSEDSPPVS